jgi:hypothetical protein
MIQLLEFGMGGQEWIWIFLVISTIIFFTVRSIKRNAAMKAENQILKKRIDYNALQELDKLKQSGILSETEFQKKKEEILNQK